MKVLVIIISYNFEQWMDRCLGSLRLTKHPVDVIVIDNGSKDQSIERLQKDYPEVRLIKNGTNLGFGRANNIGMQIALSEGYDFVFLMNQDAWIEPDTIGTLISLSQKYPDFGILSPVHLTGKGDKLDPGFGHYAGFTEISKLTTEKEIIPLPFINAAFWMIPVSVLKDVGGFSPLFYHYGEDKDFINRLHYHRYKTGYSPKAFGNHDREYRSMTHAAFLHTEYVYHLSEYANVNHTDARAFGYGVLATWKKSIEAMINRKFKLGKAYFVMAFRLLSQSGKVFTQRKNNRLSKPHYLQ